MEEQELCAIINNCDLVLWDQCFLTIDTCLCRELYEIRQLEKLPSISYRLKKNLEHISWFLDEIIPRSNVYTTPEILDETSVFQRIIQDSFTYHQAQRGNLVSRQEKFRKRRDGRPSEEESGISKPERRKKIREAREELWRDANEGLNLLNELWNSLDSVITSSKVWSEKIIYIPRMNPHISENDYGLIEAAVSYGKKNPFSEVAIFTRDMHIGDILREYLVHIDRCCYGSGVTVYNFKLEDGNMDKLTLKVVTSSLV